MASLSSDAQRMNEELRELVRPALAARMESLIDELWHDDELWKNIGERFEWGILSGHYPALLEGLSNIPDEEKDAFLKMAGTDAMRSLVPPRKQPWDQSPFLGSMDAYREELYGGMAYCYKDELQDFAGEWLEELARVGYRGMVAVPYKDGTDKLPAKEQADPLSESMVSRLLGVHEEAYPVRFENSRQVLWLQLESKGLRKHGYKEIRVSDKPLRTDKAILAALTVLEGKEVNVKELRERLAQNDESVDKLLSIQGLRKGLKGVGESNVLNLDYVFLLLRYHRPGFDDLSREERIDLIEQTCSHINELLEASRKLTAFLEYGAPGRRQKPAARDANRDVKAAVLKDVDKLTHREIGKELGIALPEDFDYKGDHPTVRQMVKRGRSILERVLGKRGWQKQIEAMRAEAERWNSLTDVEKDAEDTAEALGMPYEEALRSAREDDAYFKRRRAENQPETD
jgi:hypothetical protein